MQFGALLTVGVIRLPDKLDACNPVSHLAWSTDATWNPLY